MPRGRPPKPGTAAQKVAARREQIRLNVQALRARRKEQAILLTTSKATKITQPSQTRVQHRDKSHKARDQAPDDKLANIKASADKKGFGSESVVVEHNGRWFPLLQSLDSGSPYAVAILGIFRESFLPDSIHMPTSSIVSDDGQHWDSQDFLWTPCAFWVTSAFAKATYRSSGALRNILLAIGLGLKHMRYHDRDLEVASLQMYRKSLRSIRSSIAKVTAPGGKHKIDASELYLTCHASAMYELMRNADLRGSLQHLQGISVLIEYLEGGSDGSGQGVPLLLLQDYRMAEMSFCLRFRYESQMSRRARVLRDRKVKESESNARALQLEKGSMMIHLTDLADAVCSVMVAFDKLRAAKLDSSMVVDGLFTLLEDLDLISVGFQQLKRQLKTRHGSLFTEHELHNGETNPQGTDNVARRFSSFEVGVAWNYNLLIELFALEECINIILGLQGLSSHWKFPTESDIVLTKEKLDARLSHTRLLLLEEAIEITKCVSYFLQTDKGLSGQCMGIFPLDAARLMLTTELSRLTIDSKNLRNGVVKLEDELDAVEDRISKALEAFSVCERMQERASRFGLPGAYN